jgi:hypothetical protein
MTRDKKISFQTVFSRSNKTVRDRVYDKKGYFSGAVNAELKGTAAIDQKLMRGRA